MTFPNGTRVRIHRAGTNDTPIGTVTAQDIDGPDWVQVTYPLANGRACPGWFRVTALEHVDAG